MCVFMTVYVISIQHAHLQFHPTHQSAHIRPTSTSLRLVKPFMVVSTKLSTSCWRDLWAIGGSMVNRILMYKMKQYDIV